MTIETVPGTNIQYNLIAFDAAGNERENDPDGVMSQRFISLLGNEPITDVFIFSHGWLGDVPAAKRQYNLWVKAMADQTKDIERMRQISPNFHYLLIGLHWPSQPWGDEELKPSEVSFEMGGSTNADPLEEAVDRYAKRLADTETSREALRTIFEAAEKDLDPQRLPHEVSSAYKVLDQEAGLGHDGAGAAPGDDREAFNPDLEYGAVRQEPDNRRIPILGGLLAPLRTLSFWKMKDQARQFGEKAGFKLLKDLHQASSNDVRFHLMGHSFGSIVVSASLSGPDRKGQLIRPVNSVALVQGALSLWSYCSDIPVRRGTEGYFHNIIKGKVVGPIITTQSKFDTALSKMYPLGAGLADQVLFDPDNLDEEPTYGAVGTFGARGPGIESTFSDMLPTTASYQFESNKIYNLRSSEFICEGKGSGGAHSDIYKPEVAHAIWEAAMPL
jgi:hypothetical protein